MRNIFLLILAVLSLIVLNLGCNATRGVGTDIKDAGKHIEKIGK